jgi:hypothetical protein
MLVSSDRSLRLLALLVSLASLGFAIYDVVRIVDGISKDRSSVSKLGPVGLKIAGSESIGFGLILLLVAAVGALLATLVEMRSN